MSDSPIDLAERRDAQAAVDTKAKAFTDGLRDIADFLDDNPILIGGASGIRVYDFCFRQDNETADATVERFRAHAAVLGDPVIDSSGQYFSATMKFGPHTIQVTMPRDVIAPNPPHPLDEAFGAPA